MYAKLFAQMYDGTIVMVGWKAMVTFQQLIILADQDGIVEHDRSTEHAHFIQRIAVLLFETASPMNEEAVENQNQVVEEMRLELLAQRLASLRGDGPVSREQGFDVRAAGFEIIFFISAYTQHSMSPV